MSWLVTWLVGPGEPGGPWNGHSLRRALQRTFNKICAEPCVSSFPVKDTSLARCDKQPLLRYFADLITARSLPMSKIVRCISMCSHTREGFGIKIFTSTLSREFVITLTESRQLSSLHWRCFSTQTDRGTRKRPRRTVYVAFDGTDLSQKLTRWT
jgi:hypothetical protein